MSPFIKVVSLHVESSMIRIIRYSPETKRMVVTFNNYIKYEYQDVPVEIFHLFLVEDKSIGNLFNNEIKSKYVAIKLEWKIQELVDSFAFDYLSAKESGLLVREIAKERNLNGELQTFLDMFDEE